MAPNIAAAIAAAREVAAHVPIPAAVPAGRIRTLDDALESAGANIEEYVKTSEHGFILAGKLFTEVYAVLNLTQVRVMWACRFNPPTGGTRFLRSFDGAREARSGRPWAVVCAEAQAADPKCQGEYDALEVPLELEADMKVGERLFRKGSLIGFTTPVTGYKPMIAWLKEVRAEFGANACIPVTFSVEAKSKSGVRGWGIPVLKVR